MAAEIRRECCNYCMWLGPVNKDNTMRKHRPVTNGGATNSVKKVQDMTQPHCPGSNKPYARFGCEIDTPEEPQMPAPTTCVHDNTARPDVTGDPVTACANKAGGTDFGAFNDEGCFYAGDCAVDVANRSAQENANAEATPEHPFSIWGEMCLDHRDQEQPKDGCEECDAESDDED